MFSPSRTSYKQKCLFFFFFLKHGLVGQLLAWSCRLYRVSRGNYNYSIRVNCVISKNRQIFNKSIDATTAVASFQSVTQIRCNTPIIYSQQEGQWNTWVEAQTDWPTLKILQFQKPVSFTQQQKVGVCETCVHVVVVVVCVCVSVCVCE